MDERFEKDGEGGTERGRSPSGGVEEDVVKVDADALALGVHGRVLYFDRQRVLDDPDGVRATLLRLVADVEEQRRPRP